MFRYFFKHLRFIVLALITCLFVLFFTQTGLYISIYIAQKFTPGQLSIERAEGYLLGDFSLYQLHYKNSDIDIRLGVISLQWMSSALLHRKFNIQSLNIHQIKALDQNIQNIQITGDIGLQDNIPLNLNIDALIDKATCGKIQLKGNTQKYNFHTIVINPFALNIEGSVQNILENTPRFSLLGSWDNLPLDKLTSQKVTSTTGTVNLLGDFHQFQAQLNTTINMPHKKVYPITADVRGDNDDLNATITLATNSNTQNILTLNGKYSPALNLHWALNIPSISNLSENLVSGNIKADGKITGLTNDTNFTVNLEGNELNYQTISLKKIISHLKVQHIQTKKLSLNLDTQLQPNGLVYTSDLEKTVIPLQKAEAHIQLKNNILNTQVEWIFDAAKHFKGNVTIKPLDVQTFDIKHLNRQHLSGELLFAMNNLDFLNTPTSQLKNIQGSLQAKFKLSGTLAQPLWDGNALLKARGEIPDLGLVLDPLSLELKSNPKDMHLTGKIISNNKTLSIAGESKFPFFESFKAKITGNDFPVINTKEYKINATPNLQIEWTKKQNESGKLTINGAIDIPSARIEPLEFTQSVELPDDVVFVSDKKKETASVFALDTQINVRLGKDVKINTHGVTGRLTGEVLVTDKNNTDTTGEGEINIVDGKYDAYGQKLDIQTGKVSFSGGPIDNPQLLVRAVRTFNTTSTLSPISNSPIPTTTADMPTATPITQFNQMTVGVEITGNMNNPVIRLFSIPSTLSQADILSFLILGRPMSQASSADGALLMRALSALNMGTGDSNQIAQQLQQTFGLDVLDVETSSQYNPSQNMVTNSTSLVIGKKLSTRLFVDYSIGLMQGTNILRIKYLLRPNWTLQTETDGANEGVDIIYTKTKD